VLDLKPVGVRRNRLLGAELPSFAELERVQAGSKRLAWPLDRDRQRDAIRDQPRAPCVADSCSVDSTSPRSTYDIDVDATATMAADERIHEEVVRALAARGRNRLSGTFRAAVFGANDGLVSNLALVLGISASGVSNHTVLVTGLAGLLAGALSMGAGEYVSVNSQRELLEASTPDPQAATALPQLDVDANELALVYRARGMSPPEAHAHAARVLDNRSSGLTGRLGAAASDTDGHEAVGTGLGAGLSSFCFFASGALIPVLPNPADQVLACGCKGETDGEVVDAQGNAGDQ